MSKKLTRREFLKRSAILGTGVAGAAILNACAPAPTPVPPPPPTTAPAVPTAAPAAPTTAPAVPTAVPPTAVPKPTVAAFDWKRFKGEKIEVQLYKTAQADLLVKYQKEFEDLTGITVGVDAPAEQQARQKIAVEFASGKPSFDALFYSYHVDKRLLGKNKWLLDLRDILKDPSMVAPDWDLSDITEAGKFWMAETDGRIDSVATKIDYPNLYCNKEIFAAKGVPIPKTFDEIVSAAQKLHDPSKNIYGIALRGLKNANTPIFCYFLLGWDIDSIDPKTLAINMNTPQAIECAKMYQNLTKNYAPPGVAGFNWNECQSVFALGQAAMWLDGLGFAGPLEDPKTSKVVGKFSYNVMPKGPKAQYAGMTGSGMAVTSFSKKPGPAWYYVMWATSKKMLSRSLAEGAGMQSRLSTFSDPEMLKTTTLPKEYLEVGIATGKIGRPALPVIVAVTEFRDIYGVALNNMIAGADCEAELKKATEQFKPVLDKTEA